MAPLTHLPRTTRPHAACVLALAIATVAGCGQTPSKPTAGVREGVMSGARSTTTKVAKASDKAATKAADAAGPAAAANASPLPGPAAAGAAGAAGAAPAAEGASPAPAGPTPTPGPALGLSHAAVASADPEATPDQFPTHVTGVPAEFVILSSADALTVVPNTGYGDMILNFDRDESHATWSFQVQGSKTFKVSGVQLTYAPPALPGGMPKPPAGDAPAGLALVAAPPTAPEGSADPAGLASLPPLPAPGPEIELPALETPPPLDLPTPPPGVELPAGMAALPTELPAPDLVQLQSFTVDHDPADLAWPTAFAPGKKYELRFGANNKETVKFLKNRLGIPKFVIQVAFRDETGAFIGDAAGKKFTLSVPVAVN